MPVPPEIRAARTYLARLRRLWSSERTRFLRTRTNSRLTSTWARARPSDDLIELSPRASGQGRELLREILCHEAAHLVVWERYGWTARPSTDRS
jgi:predicted SprT family Zn-dependent metalloprotease